MSRLLSLTKLYLPRFYRTPQNITLGEGATAQFRCASHDAQVTWGKDGLGLPRKAVFLNAESIYIPEVRLEDTGYYECSVNNTSGVVVSRAYLYVQGTDLITRSLIFTCEIILFLFSINCATFF